MIRIRYSRQRGYTLVELMVALVLAGIASAGIYRTYVSYSVMYDTQEQVIELQQNLRVALQRMLKEVRLAGYDSTGDAGATIVSATDSSLTFTMDRFDDGGTMNPDGAVDDAGENITYTISGNSLVRDDNLVAGETTTVIQALDALNFVYLDEDGNVLATPVAAATNIRAIEITVVVRTMEEDYAYTDTDSYTNLRDVNPADGSPDVVFTAPGDHYRRRAVTALVKCRNMGL